MKELKMVKGLVKEGNMQEALEKLAEITLESDDIELVDTFMSKFQTGDMMLQMVDIDNSIDLESDIYYQFHDKKDGSIVAKKVTKKCIMQSIKEIEKILNIA